MLKILSQIKYQLIYNNTYYNYYFSTMQPYAVPRLRLNATRDSSAKSRQPTKLFTSADLNLINKSSIKKTHNRQSSKNQKSMKSKTKHIRRPSIDSYVPKNYQFTPISQISMLKSMIKRTLDSEFQNNKIEQKIKNSSLFRKLQLQLQNMKRDYQKQIDSLKGQVKQLNQQIVNERHTILNLVNKREKMEREISKHTDDLIDLQQRNYEMYWDVAARLNQQGQEIEEQLFVQNIPRGLSKNDLDKLLKKCQRIGSKILVDTEEVCCICCHQMKQNELVCFLACGHSHHSQCIQDWLSINKVCPICRAEVKI